MIGMICAQPAAGGDPSLNQLREELQKVFAATPWVPPAPAASTEEMAPPDPHAIVSKEFLFATPPGAFRNDPHPPVVPEIPEPLSIRKDKSVCVKIFTPWWHGAGVLISPDGQVLTSYHLVAGSPAVKVLTLHGQILSVTNVVRYSAVHDLALLQLPGGPYPAVPVSAGVQPAAGHSLRIVGHPGSRLWKVSTGTAIRETDESGTQVLHFDSDIGQGNSGGPVLDSKGRLCAITACAAVLADGSKVKVGVSSDAILRFLGTPPPAPISLADLAAHERNRQAADILEFISTLTAGALMSWPSDMSALSVETRRDSSAGPVPSAPGEPRYALANTRVCAQTAARLLVLRLLVMRCAKIDGIDSALQDSAAQFAASLDSLLTCAETLSHAAPRTLDATRTALGKAREERDSAHRQFNLALRSLSGACRRLGLNEDDPRRVAGMARLAAQFAPPGCHVEIEEQGKKP